MDGTHDSRAKDAVDSMKTLTQDRRSKENLALLSKVRKQGNSEVDDSVTIAGVEYERKGRNRFCAITQ